MKNELLDDESEAELVDDDWQPSREQLVFIIDCHSKMFEPLSEEEGIQASSLFDLSLRVCIDVLRSRIIDSENDEICVLFTGTRVVKNSKQYENVYVFLDLDYTDVGRIKTLGNLSDEQFLQDIGVDPEQEAKAHNCLKNGLLVAKDILQNNSKAAKSILYFTPDPNPCIASEETRGQVLKEAMELPYLHVFLRVFVLPSGSKTPQIEFWREMNEVAKAENDVDDFEDDVLARLENLFDGVRKKMFLKHPLAHLKLTVFKDIEIDVQLYALIRIAKKGKLTKLNSETKDEVIRCTAFISEEPGAVIEPKDIPLISFQPKSQAVSQHYPKVVLNRTEFKELKQSCSPGIVILGFKSLNALKTYHQLTASYFVYPDERCFTQSVASFLTLHESMLKMGTCAICRCSTSRSPELRLGALVPQQETKDDDGQQVDPPGFHLILLPYMDDLRNPEDDATAHEDDAVNEEEVHATQKMVNALTLPEGYTTVDISNPQLQRHFAIVEAKALDEEVPDISTCLDETKPNEELFNSQLSHIEAFRSHFPELSKEQSADRNKRPKVSELDKESREFVETTDWKELKEKDELGSLTMQKLQLFLRYENLPVHGRKQDLIERIRDHLMRQGS